MGEVAQNRKAFRLSLVIPVWNDYDNLNRLLDQISKFDIFFEVIISDDGSDKPLDPNHLPAAAALADKIRWIRSDRRRGAGHARNIALEEVKGSHVIFFDSDDIFGCEFEKIVSAAKGFCESRSAGEHPFDFLIFRHDDSRFRNDGGGSFQTEENYWRNAGIRSELTELTLDQSVELVRISAYPWNKIYRIDFLREKSIRCTETIVHNDIELHWISFIEANTILSTTMVGAIHFVSEDGVRLTNRKGYERLEVFRALEPPIKRILSRADLKHITYLIPFIKFSRDLLVWVGTNIDQKYRSDVANLAKVYYLKNLDRSAMLFISYTDMDLAESIMNTLRSNRLP